MNRYLVKILGFTFPFLFLLVGINYVGDAAKLFQSDFESEMVRILESGNHVTNITNFDERVVQRERMKGLIASPEVLILGSSRAMLITEEFMEAKTMNYSVSGASIEDLPAIYQMYKIRGFSP